MFSLGVVCYCWKRKGWYNFVLFCGRDCTQVRCCIVILFAPFFFFYCALHGGFFNSALVTCVQSEYTRTLIDACGIARDNICHIVEAPADVPYIIRKRSSDVAEKAVSSLEGAGVFAVELFLTSDGQVYFTSS